MPTAAVNQKEWIYATEAAPILGTDMQAVIRLAKRGLITTRRIPGTKALPAHRRRAARSRYTTPGAVATSLPPTKEEAES